MILQEGEQLTVQHLGLDLGICVPQMDLSEGQR